MGLPDRAGGGVEAMPEGYAEWVADLKTRVRATQFRAARSANAEVIRLYWSVGRDIIEKQDTLGWGAKVVQRLSADMRREFPGQTGWSPTNLKYMRMFAEAFPDPDAIGQQLADQLPWGHIMALLDKVKTAEDRAWYARAAVEAGWSRNVMRAQIDSGLMARTGAAPSNFPRALAAADSDLAQQMVKDPYVFQHVGMVPGMTERALEDALMGRIQDTLLELGRGFALVGRQVPFAVDGTEYAVDCSDSWVIPIRV
jgi:predicted nuclease of restriction endonuclease-like (RecB) superfamily